MQQHGISKLDLKRQNRMHVLKILKRRGPTSRIDIANMLKLTRAAVTIITNEMIEQGIIVEVGEYKHTLEKAPRGRKKILIDINQNYKFVLGVCIEEDIVSVGLSTLSGLVLDKRNRGIDCNVDYYEITDFVKESLKSILTDNCLKNEDLLGIGFGIFPSMYSCMKVVMEDGEPNFINLADDIYAQFPVPLIFDNSVKGTAMANIDFLPDKDENRQNIAFLQIGNSLHFVVTNLSDPIYSYDNRTDFVDKMIVNKNASSICPKCQRRGCVSNEISIPAIVKKIKSVHSAENTPILYKLTGGNPDRITVDVIKRAYEAGDKTEISKVFRSVCDLYAVLLNNLYYATNPQKIVIQCWDMTDKIFDFLMESVERIAGEEVKSKISLSIIEERHRFLSGCALAIRELFYTRGGFDCYAEDLRK
ncbi:MAG: ROK family transcriptional regulator [Ruminococcus sp.]|nr:ROK family transcriptional regulator [Ruminococcus sp.]